MRRTERSGGCSYRGGVRPRAVVAFFPEADMPNPPERFEKLYQDHREDLYAYLVRSVREEHAALDILQDVFLNFFRVYREKPLPADDVQCRMYLFRTARNLLINYTGRAYSRRVQLVAEYSGTEDSVTGSKAGSVEDSVVNRLNQEAAEQHLQELLAQLPEQERTALLLRHTLDRKLEDIAEVLGTSIATASRVVRRGEKRLRELARSLPNSDYELPRS